MNLLDLLPMALQNLWARKSRTVLNTFGVVVSCTLLLLVLAGTRGARDGITRLFEKSDFARKYAVLQGYEPKSGGEQPKFEPDLPKDISDQRRQRIYDRLERQWKTRNFKRTRLLPEDLEQFRQRETNQYVLPSARLSSSAVIQDAAGNEKKTNISIGTFSEHDQGFRQRVSFGQRPSNTSLEKIWMSEYRAWQLGFRSDTQLKELVGTRIELHFYKPAPGQAMKRLRRLFPTRSPSEIILASDTLSRLIQNAEQAGLSQIEAQMIRGIGKELGIQPQQPSENKPETNPKHLVRDFEIAGIFRPDDRSDIFAVAGSQNGDLMLHWAEFESLHKETHDKQEFFSLVAAVDSPDQLAAAIAQVESEGYETRSALKVLQKVDKEVWKVRLAVAALAGVVLLIASVGIMNTTIIAVIERTPEFGVMKAIGAGDRDIRNLVLIEAALTGVLGVAMAYGIARVVDIFSSQLARNFIQERLRGQEFDFGIFVYSPLDILLVVIVAIVVCMLSSLLPSRRAAKLDPVIAMKG